MTPPVRQLQETDAAYVETTRGNGSLLLCASYAGLIEFRHLPNSAVREFFGVHVADPHNVLAYEGDEHRNRTLTLTRQNISVVSVELEQFVTMALKGHRLALELLWSEGLVDYWTEFIDPMRQNREAFLSTNAVRDYGAAAAEAALTTMREPRQAVASPQKVEAALTLAIGVELTKQVLTTGEYELDEEYSDFLNARVEQYTADPDAYAKHFRREIRNLRSMPATLPAEPDMKFVREWVQGIRTESLNPYIPH